MPKSYTKFYSLGLHWRGKEVIALKEVMRNRIHLPLLKKLGCIYTMKIFHILISYGEFYNEIELLKQQLFIFI